MYYVPSRSGQARPLVRSTEVFHLAHRIIIKLRIVIYVILKFQRLFYHIFKFNLEIIIRTEIF